MNGFTSLRRALFGAAALSFASPAAADDTAALTRALEETQAQLRALQAQVDALESALADKEAEEAAADVILLSERVDELETIAVDTDEKIGSRAVVKAFDGASLDIGGFFDTSATIAIGEEGTDAAFDRQVFELLARARLGERWDLFVAQAFVRDAPLTFSDPAQRTTPAFANNNSPVATDTVIAWGQYRQSDAFNVRFGRFITPHGIVNIEHFPASLLDTEQPQFLRPFTGQTVFANFTNGVQAHGSTFFGDDALEYSVYAGVWAGNATSGSFGGRLGYAFGRSGVKLGLNGFSGDREADVEGDRFYGGGVDVLIDRGPLLWKNELFFTSEGGGGDRLAYYSQPAFRLNDQWTLLYRYDFLDDGALGGETVEHTAGIVFDPIDNVRLRTFYRQQRNRADEGLEAAKTDIVQVGATFNF
ncbi:MAG: hypothetical protein ACFB00_11905 [Parvularculaceae bacterium]